MNSIIKCAIGAHKHGVTVTRPAWLYDYGMKLKIVGLELPTAYEVDFAHSKNETATRMVGDADGVDIPNALFESGTQILAWLYVHEDLNDGYTVYEIKIPLLQRPHVDGADPTPAQQDAIDVAIAALNDAIERTSADVVESNANAERAENAAEAAEASSTAASSSEINARGYANQAAQFAQSAQSSASTATTQAQAAASSAISAANAASSAANSAEAAETARQQAESEKEAAQTARTGAERAETNAGGSASAAANSASAAATSAANAGNSAAQAAQSADNAQKSVTAAAGSASAAAGSASSAASANTSAQQAKTDAETAKTAAESARDRAETAAQTLVLDPTLTSPTQAAQAEAVGDAVSDLKSAITALDDIVIDEYDLSNISVIHFSIQPSSGKWSKSVNSYDTYYFEVPTNAKILRIKSNATNGTVYALLSAFDTHANGQVPSYATGCTRTFIEAGNEKDIVIPDDCKYIWVTKTLGGTNYAPEFLGFNMRIPDIDNTLTRPGEAADAKVTGDKIGKIIPVSMPYSSISGYYVKYSDGALASGDNFAYTDYLSVDGISQIVYSRVIVPAQYNPQHGIAFYDENKDYISGIKSTAKGNTSGYEMYTADAPEGAKFVRCTIWNSTFSETHGIEPFMIYNKDDYDKTLIAKIDKINNEFSPTATLHAVPQSEGVQNAILTARQFTDIMWTPTEDMPGIIYSNSEYEYKTYKKGCRQKGIPYGSGLPYAQMVGDSISFDTFATAVKSANSVLYTNNVYTEGGKKACYYGVACSKLVQACWGAPELADSQKIDDLPGITKIANAGEYTFDDIQLGDGILKPNEHCTIVTDIIRSAVTLEVVAVEISEAVTPTCRRLMWSKGEFEKHFGSYGLYRYSNIANAKYQKAKYIDIEDGYEGVNDIPIAIRRGSFINMSTSNAYKADVDNEKWSTLHDIVNGVEQTSQISSSEIEIPKNRTGYHEIYPTDANGNRGNSSFYFVYEVSVSGEVSSNSVTVTYSITEGAKPWAIVFNPYNYSFITEDTGEITAEIPSGMTSCYLLFKSDYGTIKSANINLT